VKLPSDQALDRSLAVIHATIQTFIDEARQRMAAHPQLQAHPTNLLEAMLAYAAVGEEGSAPVGLSDEEIIGNVFTMLVAGEDTTASTLSWILYQLATHPEVQQKVQAEVDGQMGTTGLLDWQAIDHLPYLDAVINETLRLRPVAPFYGLQANEAVELAGLQIPQGTLIYLLSRPGSLLAENFADPQSFRPERWLATVGGCPFHSGQGPSEQVQNDQSPAAHNRQVHIPFGHGPRLCPGRNLALVEIKAALAMICHQFAVTFVGDPAQVREIFAFTMLPAGLLMRFTERVQ
jgi:cytochrome P450